MSTVDGVYYWTTSVEQKQRSPSVQVGQRRHSETVRATAAVPGASMSHTRHSSSRFNQRTLGTTTSRQSTVDECCITRCPLPQSHGSKYCDERHRCRETFYHWYTKEVRRCVRRHGSHQRWECDHAIYSNPTEFVPPGQRPVAARNAASTAAAQRGKQTYRSTSRRLEKRDMVRRCSRLFCSQSCVLDSSFCEEHEIRCAAHFCRAHKTAGSDFNDKHRCPKSTGSLGTNRIKRCKHRAGWRGSPCSARRVR